MTLYDPVGSVNPVHQRTRHQQAFLATQPHRATEIRRLVAVLQFSAAVLPLRNQRDHRILRTGLELGAMRAFHAGDVARVFYDRELHSQADAQIRHAAFAGVADCLDLTLDAALAEAAGDQDRVHVGQAPGAFRLDAFRVDVVDFGSGAVVHAGVGQRLG